MRIARVVAPLALALIAVLLPAGTASASSYDTESEFVVRINALRVSQGLRPLVVDAQATNVARYWSLQMAQSNKLAHNDALPSQIANWWKLGENVGDGVSVDALEAAFEASPPHYEHLVDPAYRQIGIGVVEVDGLMWVTEIFERAYVPRVTRAVRRTRRRPLGHWSWLHRSAPPVAQ